MRTLVYHLNDEDKARLCASPLPRDEAVFQQFEIDGLYKIVNNEEKRLLYKSDKCIMVTAIEIPQTVMIQTALLSAELSHPAYLKEILEAYNTLSRGEVNEQ